MSAFVMDLVSLLLMHHVSVQLVSMTWTSFATSSHRKVSRVGRGVVLSSVYQGVAVGPAESLSSSICRGRDPLGRALHIHYLVLPCYPPPVFSLYN